MTVPGAVEIIAEMARSRPPDVLIGAGTVTDKKTALDVIKAGAKFVVGPALILIFSRLAKRPTRFACRVVSLLPRF